MNENEVQKHHLIYYCTTIIGVFLTEQTVQFLGLNFLKYSVTGLFIYIIFLIFITKSFNFMVYVEFAKHFLRQEYNTKNSLGLGDLYLTTSAIITTFIISDIFWLISELIGDPIIEAMLLIIITPPTYLFIYKINSKLKFVGDII